MRNQIAAHAQKGVKSPFNNPTLFKNSRGHSVVVYLYLI